MPCFLCTLLFEILSFNLIPELKFLTYKIIMIANAMK